MTPTEVLLNDLCESGRISKERYVGVLDPENRGSCAYLVWGDGVTWTVKSKNGSIRKRSVEAPLNGLRSLARAGRNMVLREPEVVVDGHRNGLNVYKSDLTGDVKSHLYFGSAFFFNQLTAARWFDQ